MGDKLDHVFKILLIGDTGVGKSRYKGFLKLNCNEILCDFNVDDNILC